jgi:hypothetical protein
MLTGTLGGRTHRSPARIACSAALALAFLALTAPVAHATIRVWNENEPAGDPTLITYRLSTPERPQFGPDFKLGHDASTSFGVDPAVYGTTYFIQALPPVGWTVKDIQCVGSSGSSFTIDVPNGRVTLVHSAGAEQTCTFTNSRVSGSGGGASSSSGISPTVPASELSKVALPRGPALLGVRVGRGFATATVRLTRRSIIKAQLLWHGRVVGSARATHNAGTPTLRVALKGSSWRALRTRGLTRATLTLRVVVVAGKATKVFRYRALVRL